VILHIGIMAKAPVPGLAKTRLAPLLGLEGAADLQRVLIWRALGTACAAAPHAVTLFTEGDPDHLFWRDCNAAFGVPCLAQQGSDLGQRMRHAMAALLEHSPHAILIGTDCPALGEQEIQRADSSLRNARLVFVPAEDGGYVLIGASASAPFVFQGITWGGEEVMRQTRDAMRGAGWQAGVDWLELPALWDVDLPADFRRAVATGLLPHVRPLTVALN
jgi:uncharacterized protein